MPRLFNNDHNVSGTDYPVPKENDTPIEEKLPDEEAYSFDEFNMSPRKEESEESARSALKQRFLKPVAALMIVTAVVFASFGRDPLANDAPVKEPTVTAETAGSPGSTSDGGTDPDETTDTADSKSDDTTAPADDTAGPEDTTAAPDEDEDDVFPILDNLDPDFAGDYAWSGAGSEEYIRFSRDGEATASYLQKGGAWDTYDPDGKIVTDATAVYDKGSNTLTLSGFNAAMLDVNLMGNGFTIDLVGENHIGTISIWGAMYGGSVKFIGSGSLTVDNGLFLNCEDSGSCVMVAKGVTLDISGETGAIGVLDSTLSEPAIFLSKSLKLEGGTIAAVGDATEANDGKMMYTYSVVDAEGNPSTHVLIHPAS